MLLTCKKNGTSFFSIDSAANLTTASGNITIGYGGANSTIVQNNVTAGSILQIQASATTTSSLRLVTGASGTVGTSGRVGIGTHSGTGVLSIQGNNSQAALGVAGFGLQLAAATYTDTSSSGAVTQAVANSFGTPNLAAASATTYTSAANLYIAAAPTAGANVTITNAYALQVASGTSYFGGNVAIVNQVAANRALSIRAATSQSADLLSITDSGGTNEFVDLDSTGRFTVKSGAGGLNALTAGNFSTGGVSIYAPVNTSSLLQVGSTGYLSFASSGTVMGVASTAVNTGTGTTVGGSFSPVAAASSTVNALTGVQVRLRNANSASAAVINGYGVLVSSPQTGATLPFTNLYGLYVEAQAATGVTNPYGVFQAGASDLNLFAGATSFTAAGTALSVTNNATIGGTIQVTGTTTAAAINASGAIAATSTLSVLTTTANQATIGFDASNRFTTNVSSAGSVTFDAIGASAGFIFSDTLTAPTIRTASGDLAVQAASGITAFNTAATQNRLRVYDSATAGYLELTHNGTNAVITASTGEVQIGSSGGGDVLIGAVGAAANLTFEESAAISGQGSNTIALGVSGDSFNLAVSGVTYTVGALTSAGATLTTTNTSTRALTVNGPSGLTANLLELQVNGSARLTVTSAGALTTQAGITANGNLTIASGGHIVSTGTAPTTTVNANAGTGATCTVSGGSTDVAGVITLTTGTGPALGVQCAITFAAAYGSAPKVILLGSDANGVTQLTNTYVPADGGGDTVTTTSFRLKSVAALAASTTYRFTYTVIE